MGVAEKLCNAAFAHAKKEVTPPQEPAHRWPDMTMQGYCVVPTCSYIRDRYVPKHTEYHDLVVGNAATQHQ